MFLAYVVHYELARVVLLLLLMSGTLSSASLTLPPSNHKITIKYKDNGWKTVTPGAVISQVVNSNNVYKYMIEYNNYSYVSTPGADERMECPPRDARWERLPRMYTTPYPVALYRRYREYPRRRLVPHPSLVDYKPVS